jgi:hypothetical protein
MELLDIAAAQAAGLDSEQAFLRPDGRYVEFLHLEPPIRDLHHGVRLHRHPL